VIMALQWLPEGPGLYAEGNGWTYSMSSFRGPVTLSRHNGDGNWERCGQYKSVADAATAAGRMEEVKAP